jgi:hypothetical protein
MDLTSENVEQICLDSMLTDQRLGEIMLTRGVDLTSGDDPEAMETVKKLAEKGDVVLVSGIVNAFVFDPVRLETHRDDVLSMVRQLPDTFDVKVGGGWSFLNMAETAKGDLWAEHRGMETLACLAIGLDIASWSVPKRLWAMMPGGMPYIMFAFDGSSLSQAREA